ncbi:MAG: orotidine-5'-phosphate decarboxylase [Bacteroidales bacterium]
MTAHQLFESIREKKSFLCIGLDSDIKKIPEFLLEEEDPLFEFNRRIIDATHHLAVAYKPNLAFYESLGAAGFQSLKKTVDYLKKHNLFVIADAKRGDIGNTAAMYARAFFEELGADAVTLSPYMGYDSVEPFLKYKGKWAVLLALTSNPGAAQFQMLRVDDRHRYLYEVVLEESSRWPGSEYIMYVTGATKAQEFQNIRKIVPDAFLLVPGVGAQGGSLEEVIRYGINRQCGLLVNSSRSIIYAGNGDNFDEAARIEAAGLQTKMEAALKEYKLI